ncbi:DNA-protecting protein DprA [Rhodococcus opacus]|nr:DNA-protecting protein DprA [Rhodococcus opacus]
MLERLRIIAALSDAAVIVEAGSRSGSQRLVRQVQELHRPALAFPGPVTSAASAGCHQLIRDGEASLVAGSQDILDAIAHTSDGAV